MKKLPSVLAVLAGLSLFGSPAWANGRFPGARQIALAPSDPSTLLLRTTFGQMLSHDGGQSFHWLCEELIGYGGTQDPAIAITADGSLLNAAYEGTTVSHDGGCSFPFATGLQARYNTDLTVDSSTPSHALVIVAADMQKGLAAQCWESLDNGQQWAPLSELPKGFFPQNIDVARSRPGRVYLTGLQVGTSSHPLLLRSDDGGKNWTQRDISTMAGDNAYLSAVDPQDENRLYLRVEGGTEDELLRSLDGGDSFQSLLTIPGGMLGFALSPDGSLIAAGGPSGGVLVARRDDEVFAQRSATPVTCLAWGSAGLYACGVDEISSGFALGRSLDEGATFAPLLPALGDTCGPLATCGASSSYAQFCPGRWPAIEVQLRSSGPTPAVCESGEEAGGSGGHGGVGQAGTGAGAAGIAGTVMAPAEPLPDQAGGCQLSSPVTQRVSLFWLTLGAVGMRRWRTRTRSP